MLRLLIVLLLLTVPAHAGDVSGVPSVTDGDTLRFGSVRVRIWGINAPEMNTAAGVQARDWLVDALAGQTVECVDTGSRSYNRIVARCFVNGSDIAWMLVRAGHAVDVPRYSKGFYRQ